MIVENNGLGFNLCIQVYDGIMCHNGEILSSKYVPEKKTREDFLKQYEESYKDIKKLFKNCDDAEKVLLDVKGLYSIRDLKDSGMKYWRL